MVAEKRFYNNERHDSATVSATKLYIMSCMHACIYTYYICHACMYIHFCRQLVIICISMGTIDISI